MANVETRMQFVGQITSGIDKKDTLILRTVNFVYKQLPAWRDDPDRPYQESENKLNLQLCKFLDSKARTDFPMVRFDHEEYQEERRSVDLSVSPAKSTFIGVELYTIYDPVIVIEGKRLPAPSRDRFHEYVTGKNGKISGGIQRFKLGLHGGKLATVAMIAYIQKRSIKEWHEAINEWISQLAIDPNKTNCHWSDNERLDLISEDSTKYTASYRSSHNRTGSKLSNNIEVYHLWILMNIGRAKNNM